MLLGSHNLNEGEELVAKIQSVNVETIKNTSGKDEKVPVARFYNAPPMVLNITNCRTIACLYGERYDEWAEKSIQVYATKVKAFGEEVTALRVREAIPQSGEDLSTWENTLRQCESMEQLQEAYMSIPKHMKPQLAEIKDEMKAKL